MKKILFFTHHIRSVDNPNGYRIQQYFPYFRDKGYDVMLATTKTPVPALIAALCSADVVYVQRLLPNLFKQQLLKTCARRIVFDFDDAIMYGARKESMTRRKRFEKMMKLSRAAFCGNRFLMDEAKRYKEDNVFYIPTVVETGDYPVKEHGASAHFTVGWMGSASTLSYLTDLRGLFIDAPPDTLFRVVADKAPEGLGGSVLFERWNGTREKEMLLGFDAGIMPVRDNIWSLGKCGLKLIQYAASGLPSVSHPIGVSREIIEDGESGFLRGDLEGWREAIDRLRADVELRKRMGRKARAIAEERYALSVWGPRLVSLVDGL